MNDLGGSPENAHLSLILTHLRSGKSRFNTSIKFRHKTNAESYYIPENAFNRTIEKLSATDVKSTV